MADPNRPPAPPPTPAEATGVTGTDPGAVNILVATLVTAISPVMLLFDVDKDTAAVVGVACVAVVGAVTTFIRTKTWAPSSVLAAVRAARS